MLLVPNVIVTNVAPVIGLLVAIVIGKFVIVFLTGLALHLPMRASIMAGAALAQVGEFSFVLLNAAGDESLLSERLTSNLSVAIILSMLITPMIISLSPRLAAGAGRVRIVTRYLRVPAPEDMPAQTGTLRDHVVIAGFGLTGQELAVSLKNNGVPFVAVDMNAETVRWASERGEPVCFGDVTSSEVLHNLGLEHARELVIAVNDPTAAERAVRVARELAPSVPVFVRAQYAMDVRRLVAAGAADVIVAELEASAAMTERLLSRHRVGAEAVAPELTRIRERQADEHEESA
jgi:CPA2 family monovalent cation:H+ antiporter-2